MTFQNPAACAEGFSNLVTSVLAETPLGFSNVHAQDFLTLQPGHKFDRVVMNPPFSGGADIAHFMHATKLLAPDGRITAILSTSWRHHSGKKAAEFRELMDECGAEIRPIPAGAFKTVGTQVATTMVTVDAANFPWNDKPHEHQRERAQ